MTQITRVPRGLQDFLGTQAFGDNPSELLQTVQPVLDMACWFSADKDRWYVEATGAWNSTEGQDANVVVPQGEMWFVKRIVMSVAFQSGTHTTDYATIFCRAQYLANANSPGTSIPITGHFEYDPRTGAQTVEVPFVQEFPQHLLLQPGTDLQFWHANKTGAGSFFSTFAVNYLSVDI